MNEFKATGKCGLFKNIKRKRNNISFTERMRNKITGDVIKTKNEEWMKE